MKKKTIVYIDGYNLYYGLLKGTAYKWLDLLAFARQLLPDDHEVVAVKYFTSCTLTYPHDNAAVERQNVYLQALEQQANARGLDIRFTDIRPGFVDTALLSGTFHYPMMLRPENVAREIVNAINAHNHIRVIDWRYRLLTAFWRRIPRCLWRRFKL